MCLFLVIIIIVVVDVVEVGCHLVAQAGLKLIIYGPASLRFTRILFMLSLKGIGIRSQITFFQVFALMYSRTSLFQLTCLSESPGLDSR